MGGGESGGAGCALERSPRSAAKEADFVELGDGKPRVSKGQLVLAGHKPGRAPGRRLPWSFTSPSAQPIHSLVVFLGGSVLRLVDIPGKYPELPLVVQLLLDTGEACLPLAAQGCPGVIMYRSLAPKLGVQGAVCERSPTHHLAHSSALGHARLFMLRLISMNQAPAPSSFRQLLDWKGTDRVYETDPPRHFLFTGVMSTPQREKMTFVLAQRNQLI